MLPRRRARKRLQGGTKKWLSSSIQVGPALLRLKRRRNTKSYSASKTDKQEGRPKAERLGVSEATTRFREIQAAYDILRDEQKREIYDKRHSHDNGLSVDTNSGSGGSEDIAHLLVLKAEAEAAKLAAQLARIGHPMQFFVAATASKDKAFEAYQACTQLLNNAKFRDHYFATYRRAWLEAATLADVARYNLGDHLKVLKARAEDALKASKRAKNGPPQKFYDAATESINKASEAFFVAKALWEYQIMSTNIDGNRNEFIRKQYVNTKSLFWNANKVMEDAVNVRQAAEIRAAYLKDVAAPFQAAYRWMTNNLTMQRAAKKAAKKAAQEAAKKAAQEAAQEAAQRAIQEAAQRAAQRAAHLAAQEATNALYIARTYRRAPMRFRF